MLTRNAQILNCTSGAQFSYALTQWFSNCGMWGLFRWYASNFSVIFEKLC